MKTERLWHYRILGKIGRGGMGEVYRARDLDLDRLVAIKGRLAGRPPRARAGLCTLSRPPFRADDAPDDSAGADDRAHRPGEPGASSLRGRSAIATARVYRVDAATGRQGPWKTIAPADPAGLASLYALQIADDGAWYYYTDIRELSDLYLVRGLR